MAGDLESVLLSEDRILARVGELARTIGKDYTGREIVLVGVLGGAATFTVDLARALVTRRSAAQLRAWTVRGDVAPYLDAFAMLGPLPAADLTESAPHD